ncbi:TPA: hypothetical protein QEM98_000436 [Stenotrophomonas maltophilia]|nr:hypothetical protein [Stenotrophomonas maltophilia]
MNTGTRQSPLVIYHSNCADGFTAAWAVRKRFGDDAEYVAAVHQAPPPDVSGRDVILVDFCYKPEALRTMSFAARSILVLDHHKSAAADLPQEWRTNSEFLTTIRMDGPHWIAPTTWEYFQACVLQDQYEGIGRAIVYALFDMERSGAGIAWDFFHPGVARPALINHVEDRDLWRFALPGTREIQAAVFSYPYEFEVWDALAGARLDFLREQGEAIERKHHKDVAELVGVCRRRMVIAGYDVPVASLPYTLTSDAGHLMAQGEPFAACYWDTNEGRCFSLRAADEGMDVSVIAALFGGGGHAKAAGFRVPRDHDLARA